MELEQRTKSNYGGLKSNFKLLEDVADLKAEKYSEDRVELFEKGRDAFKNYARSGLGIEDSAGYAVDLMDAYAKKQGGLTANSLVESITSSHNASRLGAFVGMTNENVVGMPYESVGGLNNNQDVSGDGFQPTEYQIEEQIKRIG